MSSLQEELEVIASLYCKEGEFKLVDTNEEHAFTINLLQGGKQLTFSCFVPKEYPAVIPRIDITCPAVNRKDFVLLKNDLYNFLEEHFLLNEPMLYDLIVWLQDHIFQYAGNKVKGTSTGNPVSTGNYACIMQLDHMRSKSKYTAMLRSWSKQLSLCGALIFVKTCIFICLHGHEGNVKDFIVRQRTQKVDIDSTGRPCKERMLKVIAEVTGVPCNLVGFESIKLQTFDELKSLFYRIGLHNVFDNAIRPIIIISTR